MKFIGKLIGSGWISASFGRTLESFILTSGITLLLSIIEGITTYLNGSSVDWELIVTTWTVGLLGSIAMGLSKYQRDKSLVE